MRAFPVSVNLGPDTASGRAAVVPLAPGCVDGAPDANTIGADSTSPKKPKNQRDGPIGHRSRSMTTAISGSHRHPQGAGRARPGGSFCLYPRPPQGSRPRRRWPRSIRKRWGPPRVLRLDHLDPVAADVIRAAWQAADTAANRKADPVVETPGSAQATEGQSDGTSAA